MNEGTHLIPQDKMSIIIGGHVWRVFQNKEDDGDTHSRPT